MRNKTIAAVAAVLMVWLLGASARADFTYRVSMDTSPLIGHPAGPFSLDFQLIDGDGLADNTVSLTNFDFGGGGVSGSPITLLGGASGELAGMVTLTDTAFLNEFEQGFLPGTSLAFDLTTTNAFAGGSSDGFSFAILDSAGSELPTLSLSGAFVQLDLAGGSLPVVSSFASDSGQSPLGGGDPIDIAAPSVRLTAGGSAPEPGTLALFAPLIAGGILLRRRQRGINGIYEGQSEVGQRHSPR